MADITRIQQILGDIPYMTQQQAAAIHNHVAKIRPAPTRFLEIGTYHGAGACYLGEIASDFGGFVWTVDIPWTGDITRFNPQAEELLGKCKISNVQVVRREDGAEGWLREFLQTNNKLDFIYLDGGHEWERVVLHTILSVLALRPGGWIIMDDINNIKYPDVGAAWRLVVKKLLGIKCYAIGNWGFIMRTADMAPNV